MENAREDEYNRAPHSRTPPPSNERKVNMPLHEMIDGFIPRAPIDADAGTIPPIGVELAIAEAGDLGQGVQEGLEKREEASQPDDHGNSRELHQTLDDGRDVQRGDLVERVAEDGSGVLGRGEPDEDAETGDLGHAFEDEGPADAWGAGVDGLVD